MLGILIGWGLIFFTFNVGFFDILPDFIGYFLIYRNMDRLCYKSDSFKKAMPITLLMTVLSLIYSVIPAFLEIGLVKVVRSVAILISFAVLYLVVKGVGELEKAESRDLRYEKLKKFSLIFIISQAVCVVVPAMDNSLFKFLLSLGALGAIVSSVAMLIYFYQANASYEFVASPQKAKAKREKKLSRKERKQKNK